MPDPSAACGGTSPGMGRSCGEADGWRDGPLLVLVKLRRVAGEVELQTIDEVTQAGEKEALVDHLGSHLEHAQSLSN